MAFEAFQSCERSSIGGDLRRVGAGYVVPVPWGGDLGFVYPLLVRELLGNPQLIDPDLPPCALPDARVDGVFTALRVDDILVFNQNGTPVEVAVELPAGAELERGAAVARRVAETAAIPPHGILALPLQTRIEPAPTPDGPAQP